MLHFIVRVMLVYKSINSHPAYLFIYLFYIYYPFFYPQIFQDENALQMPFDVEFKN